MQTEQAMRRMFCSFMLENPRVQDSSIPGRTAPNAEMRQDRYRLTARFDMAKLELLPILTHHAGMQARILLTVLAAAERAEAKRP